MLKIISSGSPTLSAECASWPYMLILIYMGGATYSQASVVRCQPGIGTPHIVGCDRFFCLDLDLVSSEIQIQEVSKDTDILCSTVRTIGFG